MVAGNFSTKSPKCIKIPTLQKLPIQKDPALSGVLTQPHPNPTKPAITNVCYLLTYKAPYRARFYLETFDNSILATFHEKYYF